MKGLKRWGVACLALVLAACGDGSVQSPDFTPELLSLSVAPATTTIATGENQHLQATGVYSTPPGSDSAQVQRDVTDLVQWSSNNNDVVEVDGSGVLTGIGAGVATVTASLDGKEDGTAVTGLGIVLREVIVSRPGPVIPGGTATYTAQGRYSDSPTPRDITDATISWSLTPAGLGTFNVTNGRTVTVTAGDATGTGTVQAAVVSGGDTLTGTAPFIVAQLTSISVTPVTATQPVGRAQEFVVTGTFAPQTGSSEILTTPVDASWSATTAAASQPTLDAACDGEASSSCKVTGRAIGTVTVTANFGGFTDTSTLTVTDAVLTAVQITPDAPTVTTRSVPTALTVPLGSSQPLYALYFYSDAPAVPLIEPRTAADLVAWASSDTAIVELTPEANNSVLALAKAKGLSNVSAAAGAISDSVAVTVGDAALESLISVKPAKAYVAVGNSAEFTAVGSFTDGTTADLPDASVNWSSADTSVATVDADGLATAGQNVDYDGVAITATLKADATSSASGTLIVTPTGCDTPLTAADGATVDVPAPVGLCVLCSVSDEEALIDSSASTAASISVPVGLLNAQQSVDVTASATAPYVVPFPAGSRASFIVSRPAGTLVLAELLSQLEVSTLLSGNVQESSSDLVPLRLDLLGLQLIDGVAEELALVTLDSSLPYDGVRLTMISGGATALSSINVIAACGTSTPPAVTSAGISSIDTENSTITTGNTTAFHVFDLVDTARMLNPSDVQWTSSDPSVATVNPLGVATGVSPGQTVITATLLDTSECGTHCSASFTLTVVSNYCTTLMTAPDVKVEGDVGGLCLFCTVENVANVIDSSDDTFSNVYVPVGLLNSSASVTVTSTSADAAPFTPARVGFLISQPTNALLTLELLSQVTIETLDADGDVIESSIDIGDGLHLDLLGATLIGGQAGVVSFEATQPYKGARLTLNSGVASVLSQLYVSSACSDVLLTD